MPVLYGMPTTSRVYNPDQQLLLPMSLSDWMQEDHLAYFVADAVNSLDLSAFYARCDGDRRRRRPIEPSMMGKVLIYAYASGVFHRGGSKRSCKKMWRFGCWRRTTFRPIARHGSFGSSI